MENCKSDNYSNIVFTCLSENETRCYQKGYSHSLIRIYSGEMIIELDGKEIATASAGKTIFVRRDHRITFIKRPANGQQYKGISMLFDRNFLRQYFNTLEAKYIPKESIPFDDIVINLSYSVNIESIFASMIPFFESSTKPLEEIVNLGLQGTILILLNLNTRFFSTLFDFSEPWKIDILDFLNENYMYEFSMEEIASFTGRSLATFKRDFKKVSNLTPQKWLIQKRLEEAHRILQKGETKISDVYMDVGFKNRSHFVTAFKKQYGVSPVNLLV